MAFKFVTNKKPREDTKEDEIKVFPKGTEAACFGEFREDFDDDVHFSERNIRVLGFFGGFSNKDSEKSELKDVMENNQDGTPKLEKSLFYIGYYW